MGWETRRGRRYYYRKRRVAGRVTSEYVGCGAWVEAMAQLEQADRLERADEREKRRAQRDRERAEEAEVGGSIGSIGMRRPRHQWVIARFWASFGRVSAVLQRGAKQSPGERNAGHESSDDCRNRVGAPSGRRRCCRDS